MPRPAQRVFHAKSVLVISFLLLLTVSSGLPGVRTLVHQAVSAASAFKGGPTGEQAESVLLAVALIPPPTDIALSSSSVADNSAPNTAVGTFSTADPDLGDTFTYSLVSGNGSVDNTSFNIAGNQLRTNSILDFETKSAYGIRVRSTDSGGAFFEKQFVITIIDGPDSPGAISFSAASYIVGEGDGNATVTLTRTGGTDNKVVAKVSLADATTSPTDYTFVPGSLDPSFNVGTGATSSDNGSLPQFVKSVIVQPDGKILIAGAFLFYNDIPRNRIARINADGTLDTSFDPGSGANNQILSMALQPDGKIIIGGLFNIYNGVSRLRLARLNSDGSLDPDFGGLPDDVVRAVTLQPDGKILIAGDFFNYNNRSSNRVARVNSDGSSDFGFNTPLGSNGGAIALALQPDGKVLVGGGFTSYGLASNTRLVRLNSNGTQDITFNSATGLSLAPHHVVLQPDEKLIVGGEFVGTDTPFGRRGIVRLNSDGSEDVSFNPGTGANGELVEVIVLQPDAKIITGGRFTSFNSASLNRIARLNSDGSLDPTFNPGAGANFPVLAVALQPDGKIVMGGQYTFYDNVSSNGITRINGDLFATWLPGDASDRTITLPIIDDPQDEPNETLNFTVTPLTGGATPGTNPTAVLTIVDNDRSVTSLSSVSGSGIFGQTAALNATLTALGAPVSGQVVSFTLNGAAVGSAITNAQGVATVTGVSLAGINAGVHPAAVGASFAGDATNFFGSSSTGSLTVLNALSINDVSIGEGDTGTRTADFTVTLSPASSVTVQADFVTVDGTATVGSDYQSTSGTVTFNPGQTTQTISVVVNGDVSFEPNETFFVNLSNPVNAASSDGQGQGTILNDDAQGGFISFSQTNYTVGESDGFVTITVNRTNDLSGAATVDYATADDSGSRVVILCPQVSGVASSRCDYTTALGTLRFAAGESSKTFVVLISQDNYVEGSEARNILLSNLTGGALFATAANAIATLTITDDASEPPINPIDVADSFVRQHYHDFLNREPDAAGLAFWTDQITSCGTDATCIELKRINVSAAFFLSIEFQKTGYLVERLYKASYGDAVGTSTIGGTHQLPVPIVHFTEFLGDTQEIGRGFVVGQPGADQVLENNKQAFIAEFVQRARFTTAHPVTMTPAQFVDALFANTGVTPSASERTSAIEEFGGAATSADSPARARALRRVAENLTFEQQEFNKAFVLMEYFGYMRRGPNNGPDVDHSGYEFWLTKLNQFGGNFINAEMVKAFIVSGEYRQRFGP